MRNYGTYFLLVILGRKRFKKLCRIRLMFFHRLEFHPKDHPKENLLSTITCRDFFLLLILLSAPVRRMNLLWWVLRGWCYRKNRFRSTISSWVHNRWWSYICFRCLKYSYPRLSLSWSKELKAGEGRIKISHEQRKNWGWNRWLLFLLSCPVRKWIRRACSRRSCCWNISS